MKRILVFFGIYLLCSPLYSQKALIYYEGPVIYAINHYAYEFQSLVEHGDNKNPICEINDSTFLMFLDKKIESVEMCINEGECIDATYKPGAMIQVLYIKDKYCYYTMNLSSGWGSPNSLTIDGKSYIPDQELQDVVLEIIKYRVVYKRPISTKKLHKILNGERIKEEETPYWPLVIIK